MTEPDLTLLIPAYNEEKRIGPVLRQYATYFRENYSGKFQILVVLNGCRDNTLGVVRDIAQQYPEISYIDIPDPIGKGGAIIEGLKQAPKCSVIGFVDADGATPPHAFHDLVKHLPTHDCVVASRWIKGAILHQQQSIKRRIASRVFHIIVELLFRLGIKDTQCGAKVIKYEAVKKILPFLCIADMAFDINLLYSLKRAGYKIAEVPTEWTDIAGSKVVLLRTALSMLLSVIRLRLVYSPFYKYLRPLRPIEKWLYKKLRSPQPLPSNPEDRSADKT